MRQSLRTRRAEKIDAPPGEEQPGAASEEREQKAFQKKLSHHQGSARAKRGPNCYLTAARSRPGQKKIRNVGARDEKHQRHRAEENHQCRAHFPDDIGVQRHDRYPGEIQVCVGVLFRETVGDRRQLRLRLLDLHARFQSADYTQKMGAAVAQSLRAEVLQRKGVLDVLVFDRKLPAGRHHTDDGMAAGRDADLLSDDLQVAAESRSPERIGQNNDAVGFVLRVFLGEAAA